MGYSDYVEMPFEQLFHIVFSEAGRVKVCGRDACRAMIERLETIYDKPGAFGNAENGQLNVPDAYIAAKGLFWLKPN